MTEAQMKNEIDKYFSDIEFLYNNIRGLIYPQSRDKITLLFGDAFEDCDSIDSLMECKLINGKRFGDIIKDITI